MSTAFATEYDLYDVWDEVYADEATYVLLPEGVTRLRGVRIA